MCILTHPGNLSVLLVSTFIYSNPNPLNLFIVSASLTPTSPWQKFSLCPFFCPCVDVMCLLWASLHPKNLRKRTNGRPDRCYLPEASEKWSFSSSPVWFFFPVVLWLFSQAKEKKKKTVWCRVCRGSPGLLFITLASRPHPPPVEM